MNLKFRAWLPEIKTLVPVVHSIDWVFNTITYGWNGEGNELKYSNFVIQQFTGALDKNQKQIFEGDIVLFDNPDPYDGQDQLTKIVGYNSRVMGFRLYNFTHEVDKYGGQVFLPEEVEVIGNIFEGAIKDGINYGEYLKEE